MTLVCCSGYAQTNRSHISVGDLTHTTEYFALSKPAALARRHYSSRRVSSTVLAPLLTASLLCWLFEVLPGTSAKFIDSINKMGFRPNSLSDYPVNRCSALFIVCARSGPGSNCTLVWRCILTRPPWTQALQTILSTGSVLSPESFDWVSANKLSKRLAALSACLDLFASSACYRAVACRSTSLSRPMSRWPRSPAARISSPVSR